MSESTFRTLLGVIVVALIVAVAWGRLSQYGLGMFPGGRPAVNPVDQLAQQPPGGPGGPGLAPFTAPAERRAGQDHWHPLPDMREQTARLVSADEAAVVAEARRDTRRHEALHPYCGGWGGWEATRSAGWTLDDWQNCMQATSNGTRAGYGYENASVLTTRAVQLVPRSASITFNDGPPAAVTTSIRANEVVYNGTNGTNGTTGTNGTHGANGTHGTNGDTDHFDHFAAAVSYQRAGNFESALAQYQAVLDANSRDAGAHNNLGLLYQSRGRMSEAIGEFQRAAALDPAYTKASNNLAVAYLHAGRTPEAIAELRRLLVQDPRNVEAMTNLALVLQASGRAKEQWVSTSTPGLRIPALVLQASGRAEEARELLQRALTINNRHATTHYNLARLFEDNREIAKAVEHYAAFLEYRSSDQIRVAEAVARHVLELQAWLRQLQPQ